MRPSMMIVAIAILFVLSVNPASAESHDPADNNGLPPTYAGAEASPEVDASVGVSSTATAVDFEGAWAGVSKGNDPNKLVVQIFRVFGNRVTGVSEGRGVSGYSRSRFAGEFDPKTGVLTTRTTKVLANQSAPGWRHCFDGISSKYIGTDGALYGSTTGGSCDDDPKSVLRRINVAQYIGVLGDTIVQLKAGTPLRTGVGQARAMFVDGSVALLRHKTDVRVIQADDKGVVLYLYGGTARSRVRPRTVDMKQVYELRTPVATTGVRGTEFEVFCGDDSSTFVLNCSGKIGVVTVKDKRELLCLPSTMLRVNPDGSYGGATTYTLPITEYQDQLERDTQALYVFGLVERTFDPVVVVSGLTTPSDLVQINDVEVETDEDGSFMSIVPLAPGTNEIVVRGSSNGSHRVVGSVYRDMR